MPKALLDWSVVVLPLVLSVWPLLISVESTLKKHPRTWRISLVLLGLLLLILTRAQQLRTDTDHKKEMDVAQARHQEEMDLVQGNFDSTKGQLLLVADTLGDYQSKQCGGLPEMASAIKRIVAALPTRAAAPAVKQRSPGSSPADHEGSQYEKFSNDQLIAAAKVIAGQISDYLGEWKYKVDVEVGARYDSERARSSGNQERIRELWAEEPKEREYVNQQYANEK